MYDDFRSLQNTIGLTIPSVIYLQRVHMPRLRFIGTAVHYVGLVTWYLAPVTFSYWGALR